MATTPVPVPDGVGRTALGMARVRADETRRPDRLFDDPYAHAFVAAAPDALPDGGALQPDDPMAAILHSAIIRTRYYDEYLINAGCRQIVLAAAGLDTRAYRLPWPDGVHLFELDLPDVLTFKQHVLADAGATPRCQRTAVPIDLRDDWPAHLTAAGHQHTEPTAWLLEGLLIYLTATEAANLLSRIGALSAPGSRLACDHTPAPAHNRSTPRSAPFTTMWKGGLAGDTPAWLATHGWQVHIDDRDTIAAAYHRPAPTPAPGGFITATAG